MIRPNSVDLSALPSTLCYTKAKKMHKLIKAFAISALSLVTATAVYGQGQWVQITTTENGDRVFFNLASQVKVFDAGYKQNTFRVLTLASSASRRSFGQQYHADCLKGTLALHKLDLMNNQGTLIVAIPLDSADKTPTVPAKGTVAAEIWRYACSQF